MIETRWEKGLWAFFVIWALVGFLKIGFQVDSAWVDAQSWPAFLKTFINFCFRWGDLGFILLAFANIVAALRHVMPTAQLVCCLVLIFISGTFIESIGTLTGFPFGSYSYTNVFGLQFPGGVPLAIPLAWIIIVAGGALAIHQVAGQRLSRWQQACLVGMGATLMDLLMEPFAWHVRGYWLWHTPQIPVQNYFAWFFIVTLLVQLTPFNFVIKKTSWDKRPVGIFLCMVVLFALGRLTYGV